MDAQYARHKMVLESRQIRDDTTPEWLKALRQYIDAVAEHACWEHQPDADGYTSSDRAGQERCEQLWSHVVTALQARSAQMQHHNI